MTAVEMIDRAERRQMDALTVGLPSKSAKMRRLAEAGYERAEIARYLGVRYQFVYNVLAARNVERAAEEGPQTPASGTAKWVWAEVGGQGQVVLPATFREALGLRDGDAVQLALEGDSIRILTRARALQELRAKVQPFLPADGRSLAEELIAERRAEAAEGQSSEDKSK